MYTAKKKKNQRINYFYKNNQINRCKPQKKKIIPKRKKTIPNYGEHTAMLSKEQKRKIIKPKLAGLHRKKTVILIRGHSR